MSIEIDPLELSFHRQFLSSQVRKLLKCIEQGHLPVRSKQQLQNSAMVQGERKKAFCVDRALDTVSARIVEESSLGKKSKSLAMKEDPPLETKCRDKFLVQSVAVAGDNEDSVGGPIWRNVDEADKAAIQEKKIKVVYLPSLSGSESTSKVTGTPNKDSIGSCKSDGASPPQDTHRSPSPETTYTPDNRTSNRQTFGISSIEAIKSSPASNVPKPPSQNYEDMLARLSKAEEIAAQYEKDDISRQSKASHEIISNEETMKLEHSIQHGSQGVPLQVVAILCFTSFLLAYLLF